VATVPSFLIQHGSNDDFVPYQQSVNFAAKLKPVLGDSKVTLEVIQGAGHGTQEFSSTSNIKKIFFFLDGVLN
jgi:pimeloyl-ACP methyl ester carboxylesterase